MDPPALPSANLLLAGSEGKSPQTGERGGDFTVPVTLAPGANTITATSELDRPDGTQRTFKRASRVLIRTSGATTGELHRATALWVAEDSSAVY